MEMNLEPDFRLKCFYASARKFFQPPIQETESLGWALKVGGALCPDCLRLGHLPSGNKAPPTFKATADPVPSDPSRETQIPNLSHQTRPLGIELPPRNQILHRHRIVARAEAHA